MTRLALVAPWFGADLNGGAERLAWELAGGLRGRGSDVTVFTTCAQSFFAPWNKNAHSPGEVELDGIRVRRFRVDRTNASAFREINRRLLATPRERRKPESGILDPATTQRFLRENITSSELADTLASEASRFDAVLFVPYLYGTTLNVWERVRERAVIVPCLHDEPYAYLEPVARMMRGASCLLFNSRGEFELARRLYGSGIEPRSRVVGSGITWPAADGATIAPINGFVPAQTPYVLYLGRQTEDKNVDFLVRAFTAFKRLEPDAPLTLVLAGEPAQFAVRDPNVVMLGRVSEGDKARLLHGARALAQPSTNESYSRTVMEAWAAERPVIVHADCTVTALALDETQAGWKAVDETEWERAFHAVAYLSESELQAIARRAGAYISENASWARVLDRYEDAIATLIDERSRGWTDAPEVVHVLAHARYGAAVTAYALQSAGTLRRHGRRSQVVSPDADRRLGTDVTSAEHAQLDDERCTVYYVGSAEEVRTAFDAVAAIDGIAVPTSATQLEETLAACTERGVERIAAMTPAVASMLRARGVAHTELPAFVDLGGWNDTPNAELMRGLQDDRANILCVAPVEPASRLHEIIDIYTHYLTLDFDARLWLVGPVTDDAYARDVGATIARLQLEHRITLAGLVSREALLAFYRTAHLAVAHRETYTTGLSLLEAMAFDVPVCARATEDTRAIMARAGILVNDVQRHIQVAGLWRVLTSDASIRRRVIAAQRERLSELSPDAAFAAVERLFGETEPVRG